MAVTIFFNIHTTRWLGVRVKQSLQNALIAFLSTASLGWTRKYHVVEKSCLQSFSWTKELWPYAFRQCMYMRLLKSSFQTSELDFVTCHVSPRFVNESTYEMQICIFMYVKKMPVVEYKRYQYKRRRVYVPWILSLKKIVFLTLIPQLLLTRSSKLWLDLLKLYFQSEQKKKNINTPLILTATFTAGQRNLNYNFYTFGERGTLKGQFKGTAM